MGADRVERAEMTEGGKREPNGLLTYPALLPRPRVFYGGSWQRGSRDLYRFVGAALAAQGIVTVAPDYSLFPPARFPMFVEDAARAVRFARESAAQWGGDPARLVLIGHSAHAYIAAMLSFDSVVRAGRSQLADRSRRFYWASRSV